MSTPRLPAHIASRIRAAKMLGHFPLLSGAPSARCARCDARAIIDAGPGFTERCANPDNPTRAELEAMVWKHTHRDFRGVTNGVRTVLILRSAGTCLEALHSLTDDELIAKLPSAIRQTVIAARKCTP